jgi:hypothetical protein
LEEKSENGALLSFKDISMNINKERGFCLLIYEYAITNCPDVL